MNDSLPVENTSQVVLLGGGGSYLRVDLTGLDSLVAPEGAVINRAEIQLPANLSPAKLGRPTFLTAFLKSDGGGISLTPEATTPGVTYGGVYDEETEAYMINLPVYAQRRLNGEEQRRYVYLYSEVSSVSLEQLVLNTPEALTPARFIVTWSR